MHEFSLGRRRFTFGAAVAAATALALPQEAISQVSATSAPATPPTPLEQQAQAAIAKLSPQAQAEVEMKITEIFRKYGDKLSPEQKADIRKVMAETQDGLEKMRAFALDNGDQPAAVFRAYRAEGSE
jgi:hypothetical protein